ncbi:helix-turn-helix domain-containing protein [Saccharopolyspora sp. NPDC002376]
MATAQVTSTGNARYTYRLRVSKTAAKALAAEWGRCRWVWNECVARSRKAYRDGETCGPAVLDKMLTDARAHNSWLREGASVTQQQIIRDFAKSRAKALKDIKARLPIRQRAGMPTPKIGSRVSPSRTGPQRVQAFRHRNDLRSDMTASVGEKRSDLRTVMDGLLVGITNPKGLVFCAAVLPQFVDQSAGQLPLQMMFLGLIQAAIGLVCDTLWGLGASAARNCLVGSPRRLSMIGGTGASH